MKRFFLAALFLVLVASPAYARSGLCDDINDLANTWNELANYLHEHEEDGISSEEADHIDPIVRRLIQPSRILANALVEEGNEEEKQMGADLQSFVQELRSRERGDLVAYVVDVIDDIVDVIDSIVDYCDDPGSRS